MPARPPFAAAAALMVGVALTGCATIAGTVGETWTVGLVGAQEVPGPGDPDGTGTARVTADATTNSVCYELTVQAITRPTAAHIHTGRLGVSGPPLVTLEEPVDGSSDACVRVDKAVAAAIIADPAGHYVNIHTADYPAGAIRGQLAR